MEAFGTQIENLYSEDDFLRRAAEKNFRTKGFDRKAFNEALYSKEKQTTDSAIGHAIPASYFYDTINDGFGSGGAMPPPGGAYYQAQLEKVPIEQKGKKEPTNVIASMIGNLYTSMIMGVKDGLYRYITQWPIILRDKVIIGATGMGPVINFLSLIYPMGGDCGGIGRIVDDWNDRLEIIINEDYEVLGFRTYTDRDPNQWYIKLLKKEHIERGERPVPRWGKPVTIENINFSDEGQIMGFKEENIGGQRLRPDQVGFDDFYDSSDTENFVTHGESKTSNPAKFRNNIVQWTLSHYIYTGGSAKVVPIGSIEARGVKKEIYRIELPHGLKMFDRQLMIRTLGMMAGIYVTHFPYKAIEESYRRVGNERAAKNTEQAEVDFMFASYRPIKYSVAYG